MSDTLPASSPAVKTAYCWFCRLDKFKHELVTFIDRKGRRRTMCVGCKAKRGKNS